MEVKGGKGWDRTVSGGEGKSRRGWRREKGGRMSEGGDDHVDGFLSKKLNSLQEEKRRLQANEVKQLDSLQGDGGPFEANRLTYSAASRIFFLDFIFFLSPLNRVLKQ